MSVALFRTVIMYVVVIFSIRIMGRRQVGELQPSELVITMLISNLAALPMENRETPLIIAILPVLALVSFEVFMSYAMKNSTFLRKTVCGSPKVIIKNGKIDQKIMKELRFSVDDLMEALRMNNVFDFSEIDCAIAETTGQLSIFKKYEYQEVQNGDIGKKQNKTSCPAFVVINDGTIDLYGMQLCEIDKNFIERTLSKNKLKLKNVLVMLCDKNKKYTIVEKE